MSTSRTRRKTGEPGGAERPPLRSAHRLAVRPQSEPGAVRPERGALPGLSGFRLLCLPRLLEGTLSEAQGAHGGPSCRGALRTSGESCWPSRPWERAAECVQDKNRAAVMETDRLLAVADFGPRGDKEDFVQSDFSDPEALDTASPSDTLGPAALSSLRGTDHEAPNRQLLENKGRREKGHGAVGPCAQSAWLSSGNRRGRGRPDRVWTMTSPPGAERGGLLRSAPRATSGAPRSRAGTKMEREGPKGADRDPAPELRWRERVRRERIVTRLRVHARRRAPSRSCRCRLRPCDVLQERW